MNKSSTLPQIAADAPPANTPQLRRSAEAPPLSHRPIRAGHPRKGNDSDAAHRLIALQDELNAAQHAILQKNDMLATLSHEVRTPMTAILGYVDLLQDCDDEAEAAELRDEAIDTIRKSVQHLLQVINNTLDMSKLESGKLCVERIAMNPWAIVEDVVTLMMSPAQTKGLTVQACRSGRIPTQIASDPTRLRQILINLVSNAIKFTDSGKITIRVTSSEDAIRGRLIQFTVSDTGQGMSPEELATVAQFHAFQQANDSTTRKFGGSGLGLHISNAFANLLGGGIEVESQPGAGSTFKVTIGAYEAVDPVTPAADGTVHDSMLPLSGARLLIAEDALDHQRLLKVILERAGAEVVIADNGVVALDVYRESIEQAKPFDAVLMDVEMPELDGHEATKQFRALGYRGPVIALTAHDSPADREHCYQAGCSDYAMKPINRKNLVSLVTRHVGNRV